MRAEVAAVRALLAATGRTTYFVEVPDTPSFPYHLVWSSGGSPGPEQAVDGVHADINDTVGVTTVAATPDGVLTAQAAARAALVAGGVPRVLDVAGRYAVLSLESSQPVQVDRDVTMTTTGRHPAFGVDVYRVVSTPA